jgi:hypothetical protein
MLSEEDLIVNTYLVKARWIVLCTPFLYILFIPFGEMIVHAGNNVVKDVNDPPSTLTLRGGGL